MRLTNPFANLLPGTLFLALMSPSIQANTLNDLPELTLPDAVQADQALNAIGNRLPVWAQYYDQTVAEFARTLREDQHAFLDTRGRLFFTEPVVDTTAEEIATANADAFSSAPYPLEQTFLLESRPNAAITLYLDFDGHTLEGTAWNDNSQTDGTGPIVALPWSRDSDRSTFSETELRDIQAIWRRVAEDFAPFDINVTTRFPGEDALIRNTSSDPFYGTRVLVTPNTFYSCSCGGVAYVGTFDYIGSDYYQPALVFNGGVGGIAEAASHEAGHNLGLSHDGTTSAGYYSGHGSGDTGWAPIMGVGYYQNLVQWSKGEYANATQTQDDYVVMANNLLPFAADDHGDNGDVATAPEITGDGITSGFSASGVIEQPHDIDAFQFTAGAGNLAIDVTPVYASPNLDIGFEIRDSSGELIAWSNAPESLATGIDLVVDAGQYTLLVDGVGKDDPLVDGYTDYGSLGGYRIAAQFADNSGLTPPVPVITSDYAPGYAPLTLSVDGSQSVNAASYSWRFGDGTTATGITASHTYANPGEYTLELTVISPENLTATSSQIIDVINQAPMAQGSIDTVAGEAPLTVTVDAGVSYDPDGQIQQYLWSFGDGATGSGVSTSHTYVSAGNHVVALTVVDDLGAEASADLGTVSVTMPVIVDSATTGETSIAGSVVGSHLDTHVADGVGQRISERESGGKKNQRYSYAEHEWLVTVPAGQSVVRVLGSQNASADGDVFQLGWATSSGSGSIGELGTSTTWLSSEPFGHQAGTLTIGLKDSVRAAGKLGLDTATIDAIAVTTDTSVDPGDVGGGGGGGTDTGLTLILADAYKVKGANQVLLNWDAAGAEVDVKRDGVRLLASTDSSYLDDALGKGGMTLSYQVCVVVTGACSNVLTVVF